MKNFRNYWLLASVLLSFMIVVSSCDDDDDDNPTNEVKFNNLALTGAAEVQTPAVMTNGSGTANITYNKDTNIISYNITWTLGNASDKTVGMHFHGPATRTQNASVVIPITLPNDNSSGTVSGQTRALTQAEEDQLLSGMWYLNIHSSTYTGGELRVQVE
ncbi:CHRD domain-containing protein [Botryobacter ruber]|uniref:CHRD domain-containing protein n=1 Tax=Botryobacter ruber TaxID=2171629 RepID=UPI000E0C4B83|nr:CHRD domain-containing protein [Botryobacter ruber]